MTEIRRWLGARRRIVALVLGAVLPLAVTSLLAPLRATFADAAASLVLVAAITLVATLGSRSAGYVATVSASLWFDFFLTRPYDQVVITGRPDIEITACLLIVGVVITELAAKNRRHHSRAEEEASYVGLLYQVSERVGAGGSFDDVVPLVREALIELLHLRDCRFVLGPSRDPNREIRRDGRVVFGGLEWPVWTWGLPGRELALPILDRGNVVGRMVLTPTPAEPVSLQRRLVAVVLADQLGAVVALRLRSA
jgi:hypothetical protein